ncbi:SDR family oxidoreductase [Allosediminivita pacifica]|uniref:NAD(P)-dependent dehydrogenase (Short-subunit alcohol dehydrogenase family) n=1 Tax=Allosediminivita pacifica TaxID=1267769 RepID=A0A2T6B9N8_9RHOB|nr:SDR family oxidoreductase [Allosediminivita pacifica]PTX52774.1 NAD(P)-dependent dehydrogenase (short-subunit alcohol dehydrogenase family) [Allosediminivita pacifica]GGA95910.1 oxidoreductase [Allosediminivita pacifica]
MRVLITGASRGIGAALLQGFTARGDDAQGTARSAGDGLLPLDVTDPGSQRALADRLEGQPLDALICNAGIYPDKGQSLERGYPPEMWAETFATNVTGVFLAVQALLPNLRQGTDPRIAIISSQMASDERAPGGSYIYRASKAAALNLGRNLAVDLKSEGIAVGIYHPGWVRTDMGGESAAISVEESAQGLMARLDALGLANTGCFETWDGQPHPF